MTPPTIAERRPEVVTRGVRKQRAAWVEAATSADHKVVAKLFMGTALTFLAVAALQFFLTRLHLIVPDSTIFSPEKFVRIMSASSVTITVLFAIPFTLGLLGYIVPLQIGARGVAMPRLNHLSYWLYAFGALSIYASFLYTVPETALSPLPPLSDDVYSPSHGVDAWVAGVGLATLGFICFAINMVATLKNNRAPGMAWRRAPILASAARVISYMLLVIGPAMLAGLTMLTIDRHFGGVFFDSGESGEPLLFSHLSWIYFTGIHTILLIVSFAVISEIVPTFSRKPLFSHSAAITSLVAVGVLGLLAWMQNMYAAPIADGFAYMAMFAAVMLLVPVGLLYFNWISTMWNGQVSARAPLLLALSAAVLIGFGLIGQLVTAVIPAGLLLENSTAAQQDTIIVLVGFILAAFAALHYWLPKVSGRFVADGPAKGTIALVFIGANLFGWSMFFAGIGGQPVDVFRYYEGEGLSTLNLIAFFGALFMMLGVFAELASFARSWVAGRPAGHDPWRGSTLEWFALSPPPAHNFDAVPDVRSAEPLRDIREAIREREASFVPPEPLPATAPPEVGQPDPGDEGGLSEDAAEMPAPTADTEDVVSDEAAEDQEVEPSDESAPDEAHTEGEDEDDAEEATDDDSEPDGDDSSVS